MGNAIMGNYLVRGSDIGGGGTRTMDKGHDLVKRTWKPVEAGYWGGENGRAGIEGHGVVDGKEYTKDYLGRLQAATTVHTRYGWVHFPDAGPNPLWGLIATLEKDTFNDFGTSGFAGGRPDTWDADKAGYRGGQTTWLGNDVRYSNGRAGIEGHGIVGGEESMKDYRDIDSRNRAAAHIDNCLAHLYHAFLGPEIPKMENMATGIELISELEGIQEEFNSGSKMGFPVDLIKATWDYLAKAKQATHVNAASANPDHFPGAFPRALPGREIPKMEILATGVGRTKLTSTAWAPTSSFRGSDNCGGANSARIRLAPQKDGKFSNPAQLKEVPGALEGVQEEFNSGSKMVSLAGIMAKGAAFMEAASVFARLKLGRTNASQEQTDAKSRNYGKGTLHVHTEQSLVDKAHPLTISAPGMTVLVGGLHALNANYDGSSYGVFTKTPGKLTNDFFVKALNGDAETFEGSDRKTGAKKWTATRSDLVFGSHAELRGIAEGYGSSDAGENFVKDFVAAWDKVMNLGRFDVTYSAAG